MLVENRESSEVGATRRGEGEDVYGGEEMRRVEGDRGRKTERGREEGGKERHRFYEVDAPLVYELAAFLVNLSRDLSFFIPSIVAATWSLPPPIFFFL